MALAPPAHVIAQRTAAVAGGWYSIFVNTTAGSGHDTIFLAELTGRMRHGYAFDVQTAALKAIRNRLEATRLSMDGRL